MSKTKLKTKGSAETTAILFNGPPGSGKDYAVKTLIQRLTEAGFYAVHNQFKDKLIELTCAVYSFPRDEWDRIYDGYDDLEVGRRNKEVAIERLDGNSMREALIHVSERVIKPSIGKDYFGRSAAANLTKGAINLFSDSGFLEETIPVAEASDGLLVVRIHADGIDYKGDSRGYLSWPGAVDINNDFTDKFIDELLVKIDQSNIIKPEQTIDQMSCNNSNILCLGLKFGDSDTVMLDRKSASNLGRFANDLASDNGVKKIVESGFIDLPVLDVSTGVTHLINERVASEINRQFEAKTDYRQVIMSDEPLCGYRSDQSDQKHLRDEL